MIAESINIIGDFLGKRDVPTLNQDELCRKYGFPQADVFVLFGGSILAGAEVFAEAVKNEVAKEYAIVGGHGHTTPSLRKFVETECPGLEAAEMSEAEIFNSYIRNRYGVCADYLETQSTNCGNNITYLLKLLDENQIRFSSIILCQDATMQLRMSAVLKKYCPDAEIINFASYHVVVEEDGGVLGYTEGIHGMWSIDDYIRLLMGEIPRLTDDCNGYGPKGKNYLAHVDIPEEVNAAFDELKEHYADHVREANPEFASGGERP